MMYILFYVQIVIQRKGRGNHLQNTPFAEFITGASHTAGNEQFNSLLLLVQLSRGNETPGSAEEVDG